MHRCEELLTRSCEKNENYYRKYSRERNQRAFKKLYEKEKSSDLNRHKCVCLFSIDAGNRRRTTISLIICFVYIRVFLRFSARVNKRRRKWKENAEQKQPATIKSNRNNCDNFFLFCCCCCRCRCVLSSYFPVYHRNFAHYLQTLRDRLILQFGIKRLKRNNVNDEDRSRLKQ